MSSPPNPEQSEPELAPLNPIRVETALSRYPVHCLAKRGMVNIELSEGDGHGQTTFRWEVDYGQKHGQPGPLAYKIDTLVINRRIEEASRPIPRIVKLGSLREIAEAVGAGAGNTSKIKKALYQNATTLIAAKVRYRLVDGTERTIEFGDTRYGVVFAGERLPDGRAADAVYVVLHDFY